MPDPHPHQPTNTDVDPTFEKQSTPGGVQRDMEDKAEELGATTDPDEAEAMEPDVLPGGPG